MHIEFTLFKEQSEGVRIGEAGQTDANHMTKTELLEAKRMIETLK